MKERIQKLKDEGKTHLEISKEIGCSKSTVSYWCNKETREKAKSKNIKRKSQLLIRKSDTFKTKVKKFQLTQGGSDHRYGLVTTFTTKDLFNKIGDTPKCYLTGRSIDLSLTKTYHLDHIIPFSKGGPSTIENVGLACKEANLAKSDLLLEDFINLCKEVLEHNGYIITNIKLNK